MDARAIARTLSISLHTCRGYVKSALAKLDCHSQLEAVVAAGPARAAVAPGGAALILWSPRGRRLSVVARALAQHAVVSVMALVVVGATASIICVRVVQAQALRQAEAGGEVVAERSSLRRSPRGCTTATGRP